MSTNFWYFGLNAGLDFSGGNPVFIGGSALNTNEGTAVVSDSITGTLHFYTDGMTVWDRTHTAMPNGTGLTGHSSSCQSAIILPRPATPNRYYIFCTPLQGSATGVTYSEVDMTLNGGDGDVLGANKNTFLFGPSTEQITAVKHCNGSDYWIISHQFGNNNFYAYQVTSAAVLGPVISAVGGAFTGGGTTGQLKASPDGKRLAVCTNFQQLEQYYDFDNTTGIVSNAVTLPTGWAYGCSFSPDNSRLYIGEILSKNVFQFDMTQPTPALINASMTLVGTDIFTATQGCLQLGRNGRLYCARWGNPFLNEIPNPNLLAPACGWNVAGVSWGGNLSQLGLPNFPQSDFAAGPPCLPLAVELLEFNADWDNEGNVQLNWLTATEEDLDFFTIERSVNGETYEDVHSQQALGNSNSNNGYDAIDINPPTGDLLYRLRMVDLDGDVELSKVVHLSRGPVGITIGLYPNPVNDVIYLESNSDEGQMIIVQLFDITGKLQLQEAVYVQQGFFRAEVPLYLLSPGFYIAKLANPETGEVLLQQKVQKL